MENDYYVYEWIRLDTNLPFYIGKGRKNRWCNLTRGNNYHFNNIVKTIPVAVNILQSNLEEGIAYQYECWYINEYNNEIGYDLVNATDGGDNPPHGSGDKNNNFGNHWSDEQKKIARDRIVLSGRYKGANNPRATRIMCVETGKIYSQIKEAGEELGLKDSGSISIALSDKARVAYELHWCKIDLTNEQYMLDEHNRFIYLTEAYAISKCKNAILCLADELIFKTRKEFINFTKKPYRIVQQYFKDHAKIMHNNKEYIFARDYSRLT